MGKGGGSLDETHGLSSCMPHMMMSSRHVGRFFLCHDVTCSKSNVSMKQMACQDPDEFKEPFIPSQIQLQGPLFELISA